MKEVIRKYQKVIIGMGTISVLIVCYFQQRELKKLRSEDKIEVLVGGDINTAHTIDSLHHLTDSLHWELLPAQIELGRYQVAYEIFMERNPKAAKQYGDIISNETE